MAKEVNKERQIYREMVETLLPYAEEQLKHISSKLIPGNSYTAPDIVKIYGVDKCERTTGDYIKNDLGTFQISKCNIFYQIKNLEKLSGLTGKKAHFWTVPDNRRISALGTMTFPKERMMKIHAGIVKEMSKFDHEIAVISLADGCLRSIVVDNSNAYYSKSPFRIKTGFKSGPEYGHLSFKIDSKQIRHMYDECRISIYKDSVPDLSSYLNPYHVRIVIENAKGWCISSDTVVPVSKEYIEIFDAQFSSSYNDDRLPQKKTKTDSEDNSKPDPEPPVCLSDDMYDPEIICELKQEQIQDKDLESEQESLQNILIDDRCLSLWGTKQQRSYNLLLSESKAVHIPTEYRCGKRYLICRLSWKELSFLDLPSDNSNPVRLLPYFPRST